MTEMERLKERLFPKDGPHIKNIHIEWGPEAHRLTPDERAGAVNKVLDQLEAGDFEIDHFEDDEVTDLKALDDPK